MDQKNIFESRRSVRYFDPERELPDELLRRIIDLAVNAPSAFNLQPWEIIAVKTPEAKQLLADNSGGQPKILEAPVTLILVGDRKGYSLSNAMWDELKKRFKTEAGLKAAVDSAHSLYGSSPERQIKFAESNTGLLAMSIMYAASFLGVDSHPMSGVDFDGIKEAFDIADGKAVVMLIALGYADKNKELAPRQKRKKYDEVVTEK